MKLLATLLLVIFSSPAITSSDNDTTQKRISIYDNKILFKGDIYNEPSDFIQAIKSLPKGNITIFKHPCASDEDFEIIVNYLTSLGLKSYRISGMTCICDEYLKELRRSI